MAIKTIISYPQEKHILQAQSVAIAMDDPELPRIITDLKDTLLATPGGVGLAAPQIGILKRIFVLSKDYVSGDLDNNSALLQGSQQAFVFINPKIISEKGEIVEDEGCLSVPGEYIKIKRAKTIKVRAYNEGGVQFYERFKGLASRAIQQEIDHLNGVLIINHRDSV